MRDSVFLYADGGEGRLEHLFQPGHEEELKEVRRAPQNWELLYHLSPLRANLLRWINFAQRETVEILEIGAGCGAITEFLVSLGTGVRVTAVEGDAARARVIAQRCRNAPNLDVVHSNIAGYRTNRKYDFVLSIGVLEYSGKYIEGADPYSEFLWNAASFLKDDGQLIVAIENQLGHKYMAGIPEDHYGTPYEGLSNYPAYDGIRTFSKQALSHMLAAAGLPAQQWYFPFPDYKLPTVVISEEGLKSPGFDWLSLLSFPTQDSCFGRKSDFNEKEFLRLLAKNVDVTVFMNSFLVLAGKKEKPRSGFLAAKFNALRAKQHQTTKVFLRNEDGSMTVKTVPEGAKEGRIDPYHAGYLNLHNELVDAVFLNRAERMEECFELWLRVLEARRLRSNKGASELFDAFSRREFLSRIYPDVQEWFDADCVDFIPRNILFHDTTKDVRVIDLEWKAECPVPEMMVVNRGMYDLLTDLQKLRGGPLYDERNYWNLPQSISRRIPPLFNGSPVDRFSAEMVEVWLGHVAEGVEPPIRDVDVQVVRQRIAPEDRTTAAAAPVAVQRGLLKRGATGVARLLGRSRVVRRVAASILNG